MRALRATAVVVLALAAGALLVSGGSDADPRTPPPLPGLPPPFLGTAVTGDGGITAALDAYGDVVDLRPSPAGPALIDNPAARQAAGTVPVATGIVPRVRVGGGPALPLWRADSVRQRYLAGTNVVQTVALFGGERVVETAAANGGELALRVEAREAARAGAAAAASDGDGGARPSGGESPPTLSATVDVESGADCARRSGGGSLVITCDTEPESADRFDSPPGPTGIPGAAAGARALVHRAISADHRWTSHASPLGAAAPGWARETYRRSLLVLHALTGGNGAVAAGARDGWAYVWPRDAATAALAYAAAGYRGEARRVARFLSRLEAPGGESGGPVDEVAPAPAAAAARFEGDGSPVPGRGPQGDAAGWIAIAARAAGLRPPSPEPAGAWRGLPDYQEGAPGDYLGNAIAATAARAPGAASGSSGAGRGGEATAAAAGIRAEFATMGGLIHSAGDSGSGLDSAAAWAVRPFDLPALKPDAERTLLALARRGGRFGITPGTGWNGGGDPWTAPTAAVAWSLAALSREAAAPRGARAVRRQGRRADRNRESGAAHDRVSRDARDRAAALGLLADLRRAATSAGALPERIDAGTGIPRSTTPLAWSHAFTVLALRELWPG